MSALLSPKREVCEQAGIAFGKGKGVQGKDRRDSGGTPEVTETLFSPTLPLFGESGGGGGCAFISDDPMVMISCMRLFSMQDWI